MNATSRLLAPCKVNLHLGVHVEKDDRGYHHVDSVMVPVDLYDEIRIEDAPELSVSYEPDLGIPIERTCVWRAATLLAEVLGVAPNVSIRVSLRIPERAGLGGSSADGGAVLRTLAKRWGVDPLDARVVAVAQHVGADVAFFLCPVPSLWLGGGDTLAETYCDLDLPLALVTPGPIGASTKAVYDEFDRRPEDPQSYEPLCAALRLGYADNVPELLANNLAPAAVRLTPAVGEVERWLQGQSGVVAAQVTGSGACSFAICESFLAAERVAECASSKGWWSFATRTVGSWGEVC